MELEVGVLTKGAGEVVQRVDLGVASRLGSVIFEQTHLLVLDAREEAAVTRVAEEVVHV